MRQCDMIRLLVRKHGFNEEVVCAAYAAAEERGEVPRVSNKYGWSARQYARALYKNYLRKGLF
jgi:hypothetical protein